MSLKCFIGLHSWDGCKCSDCEKVRYKEHDWDGCKCNKCGKTRQMDIYHEWSDNYEYCTKCGVTKREFYRNVSYETKFYVDDQD
jgi:Zn ribbon nucleic-acid-binding protein